MLGAIFVNIFLTFLCFYLAIYKASYDAILIASTIYLLAHTVGFSASGLVNQIKMK